MPWNKYEPIVRILFLLTVLLLVSCASRPSKYKKKKGCDCPKWTRSDLPSKQSLTDAYPVGSHCHPS